MLAHTRLVLLVAPLLLLGCHRASPEVALDLAIAERKEPGPLPCARIQDCVEACGPSLPKPCVQACIARLTPAARPLYEALEACVVPACATAPDGGSAPPCAQPGSFGCKLCAMSHCSQAATACMSH